MTTYSALTSTASASSNASAKLSHADRYPPASVSHGVPDEGTSFRRKALIYEPGFSTRQIDPSQVIEAYRQLREDYGQTSASPHDLTQALTARDYHKTQWLMEKFFDQVAIQEYSWLTELVQLGLSHLEITDELLEKAIHGSWIHEPFELPRSEVFTAGLHQSNCVHNKYPVDSVDSVYRPSPHSSNMIVSGPGDGVQDGNTPQPGAHGLRDDMKDPLTSERVNHEVTLAARQRIEYFCGLGGVRPAADGSTDIEFGSVSFKENNSRAFLTLKEPADNSDVIEVLDNLSRAAGELQRLGGCCDSFSVLVESASDDFVELHRVPFETIRKFRRMGLDHDVNELDERFFLDLFGPVDFIDPMTGQGASRQHWFLVAAQFLAIGLLSYTQAHSRPIQPFFLDSPLQAAYLLGSGNSETAPFTLGCHLVNLTCMGDMTGQPVIAFGWVPSLSMHERPLTPSARRKDMLASPVDILDTWGPGLMVTDANYSNILHSIVVGGGTITSTAGSSGSSTLPLLHWRREDGNGPTATGAFFRDAKALIGRTILENKGCQAAAARLKNSLPILEEIGTFPSYWELMERQLGLGLQGGQAAVGIVQFNQTWVKMMGTTKKSAMLSQRSIYISDLDKLFGVQVSICTGIARRVRLRDLLADLLPAYVSGLVVEPLLWKDLLGKYDVLAALQASDLRNWLESLDHPCRAEFEGLVFAVLYLLRDTGIDRKGDYFVIACVQRDLPFQCFKIPCKNENYWARMLIDSEDSATFAYVTTQCLETAALKCCRPSPSWFNSTALLGTAVSEDRVAAAYATAAVPATGQWTLKENEAYLIGHPDRVLSVQVKTPNGLDPHLLVSLSTIPPEFLKRLFRKGKPKRLKERKCFDSCAESVVICVEKMGINARS